MKHDVILSSAAAQAHAIVAAWDAIESREDAECFLDFAIRDLGAGEPLPAFTTIAAEAERWAAFASLAELKVYAAAIIARLPQADRAGLQAYVGKMMAA